MNRKIPLDQVLVVNSTYARHLLKSRLIKENLVQYECAVCRNPGIWNGQKLSLHLDHANGVYNDNRIENLRFLCPNCHAQTDTYAGKNIIGKQNKSSAKGDYRFRKRESDAIKWAAVKSSDIDFSKRGWVGKVASQLQISPQKVGKWLMRVDPAFYIQQYSIGE